MTFSASAALIAAVVTAAACSRQESPQVAAPRVSELTPIRLPVRYAAPHEDPACDPSVTSLTIRVAREEQLPEGPQSFAVVDGSTFVVADPLHERLAFFTREGTFQRAICVGAPVAEIEVAGKGQLRIRKAGDPSARVIDHDGRTVPAAQLESADAQPEPMLTSDRSAVVRWKSAAETGAGQQPAQIEIGLDDVARRLASVQVIAEERGNTYVSLESTGSSPRAPPVVGITVRRYSRAGALESEVTGISADYYIAPTTPFRVVDGVLYQLFSTEKELLIRAWQLR